jgi:hypothetical protein
MQEGMLNGDGWVPPGYDIVPTPHGNSNPHEGDKSTKLRIQTTEQGN